MLLYDVMFPLLEYSKNKLCMFISPYHIVRHQVPLHGAEKDDDQQPCFQYCFPYTRGRRMPCRWPNVYTEHDQS